MYYEAHITFRTIDPLLIQLHVEERGWSFSRIAGDELFGAETLCYATKSCRATVDLLELLGLLDATVDEFRVAGLYVVRSKLELVVYDRRHP